MDERLILSSMARHATSPEVSVRKYVGGLMADLGNSIAGRHKLYLDTRYWIYLRDAAMGRAKYPCHKEILDYVRSLVSTGYAICPVSDVAWMELFKQTDPQTRLATADLLDELSLGVAILTEQERVISEIERFIIPSGIAEPVENTKQNVWVKTGYVLGIAIPTVDKWSQELNLRLQKTSVDMLWNVTHRDLTEAADGVLPMTNSLEQSAVKITENMRLYAHEIRSIQQAFTAEISGALKLFKDDIGVLMLRHFRNTTGNRGPMQNELVESAAQTTLTAVINAFRLRPKIMAQQIPSLYTYAMCHAAVRMDRTRRFNGHDLLDIHHASSGIPYHDAVFTENPLRVLVTAGNVALDKTYGCTVLAKEVEVLDYLRNLSETLPLAERPK